MQVRYTDVVIIGSGLAGLYSAFLLSSKRKVTLITKSNMGESNSSLAQGGIAAAIGKDDHWKDHLQDTLLAGGYHNDKCSSEILTKNSQTLIKKLLKLGVKFDRNGSGDFSLGLEGAHKKRRILHVGGDATGKGLVEAVKYATYQNIHTFEHEFAYDLYMVNGICHGVFSKDESNRICLTIASYGVILATGGIGQLYGTTSNCREATGDGVAMAYRAGAVLHDMEFIQFHPTILIDHQETSTLISEAVRGEGAKLITSDGQYLMNGKHPLEDLAPRDIVAREIFQAIENGGEVFLQTEKITDFESRFPTIYEACKHVPSFLKHQLIPIKPGAHFIMGGIKVDDFGRTTVKNLFAVGECAHTGVHGANRLASNSLLEAVVFADRLCKVLLHCERSFEVLDLPKVKTNRLELDLPDLSEIKEVMDRYVGIIRTERGLREALASFGKYDEALQLNSYLSLSKKEMTMINLLTIGKLVVSSALLRDESRGAHFRIDIPITDDEKWLGCRTYCHNGVINIEKKRSFIQIETV